MTPEVKQTVHRLLVFDVKRMMEGGWVPTPDKLIDLLSVTESKARASGLAYWTVTSYLKVDAKGKQTAQLNLGGERFTATLQPQSTEWSIQDDDQN